MTSPIGSMLPDLGLVTSTKFVADRQTDAENQRQTWLRQMEGNQISMLEQSDDQNGARFDGNAASGTSSNGERQSPDLKQIPACDDTSKVTLLPVHPIVQQDDGVQASGSVSGNSQGSGHLSMQASGAAAQPAAVTATSATDQAAPSDASAAPGITSAAATTGVAVAHAPAAGAANNAMRQNMQAQIVNAATPSAANQYTSAAVGVVASSGMQGAANAVAPQSEQPAMQDQTTTQAAPAPAIGTRAAMPAATPHETANLGDGDEETVEAQHEGSAPEQSDSSAGQTWQKRFMHVAQDGKDVSISIRDSALDAGQSAAIVTRMAADAAQAGLKLNAATVNGKTFVKQDKAGSKHSDGRSSAGNLADASFLISNINGGNAFEEQ